MKRLLGPLLSLFSTSLLLAATPTTEQVLEWVKAEDYSSVRDAGPEVMAPLAEIYSLSDEPTRTRIAHYFYDLRLESEAARQAMWPDLDTQNAGLRLAVQWAIGRVSDDDRVVEALIERMRHDPNPLFRDKAACGLASDQIHLSDRQNYRLNKRLIDLLESPELETRALVAQVLKVRTGSNRGFRPNDSPEARAAAVASWREWIARWGSPAAALEGSLPPAPRSASVAEADITPLSILPFEQETAAGPDTFKVFQKARGSVVRTPLYRMSGNFSVEIRDVPGDGDFPELQGFFEKRASGKVYVHFAFLVADPAEPWNFALAGPDGFQVKADGIAIWLQGREGKLLQVSDQQPRYVLDLAAFTWYQLDLIYDVTAGRYDLTLEREGDSEPVVRLRDQTNAPGAADSAVELLSFIGDTGEDLSSVVYYVDDIQIAALEHVEMSGVYRIGDTQITEIEHAGLSDFVAPGRRKLFVELFGQEREIASRQFGCFHAVEAADLGLDPATLDADLQARLVAIVTRPEPDAEAANDLADRPELAAAIRQWQAACSVLGRRPDVALELFRSALETMPSGRLFALSQVGALARLGKFAEAEELVDNLAPAWRDDPRPQLLGSMLALANGDAERAASMLQPWSDRLARGPVDQAPAGALIDGSGWLRLRAAWIAEQQWLNLMRARRHLEAEVVARAAREQGGLDPLVWLEREADAALLAGDAKGANQLYDLILGSVSSASARRLSLKKADAFFLLGDLASEKALREQVYESLERAGN